MTAEQHIIDCLNDFKDELSRTACDNCNNCSKLSMCSFHSLLSALEGSIWTNSGRERNDEPFRTQLD